MHTAAISKKAQCSETLERIIEASRHEFLAVGVAATKIDSIAARANLTRQSIYYYYKNKREIFYDIVIREANVLVARFDCLDVEAAAPEATIKEMFLGLHDNADDLPMLTAFMIDRVCLSGSDKKAKTIFANIMQQIARRLQVVLDRGAEQGTLRPGVDAARFFAAACMLTSGVRNKQQALEMICGIHVSVEEEMNSWQLFAVDLLMRSIRVTN